MDNTYYSRMVLLNEQVYNSMKHSTEVPTQLPSEDIQLPADRYMKLYGNMLDKQKPTSSIEVEAPPVPVKTEWLNESLQYLPQSNKNKATQLLHFLNHKQPEVSWNELGEIKSFNFDTIPQSNILDLVNYVTTPRKTFTPPIGAPEFLHLLQSLNVPHSLLSQQGNLELRKAIHNTPLKKHSSRREKDSTPSKWTSLK